MGSKFRVLSFRQSSIELLFRKALDLGHVVDDGILLVEFVSHLKDGLPVIEL